MDWLVLSVGTLALLGTMVALLFLPQWLKRRDVIWLIIATGLLTASGTFLLSLFGQITQVSYEDRAIFLLFWGGVLVALNGTIVLKLHAGNLAPQIVDVDDE